ncbi:MAG: hypothetical protein H7A37_09410 [Chlamydiales bacterium]|nr:hypothetical protein [Chlamydiales bacterium]
MCGARGYAPLALPRQGSRPPCIPILWVWVVNVCGCCEVVCSFPEDGSAILRKAAGALAATAAQ